MALVRGAPFDVRDYGLELDDRAGRRAGRQTRRMAIPRLPSGTGEPILKFETVHERQYHLFVISQDMTHFQHIHPELQADGTWVIDVTLPKAGYYKVLSDFLPAGGASQFIARPLVTADYTGDLAGDSARLAADAEPDPDGGRSHGDVSATIRRHSSPGCTVTCSFRLTDTAPGQPVTDLQTYLGAFGHTLIMSEDLNEYVHSHSLDIVPGGNDDEEMPQFLIPPGADLEKLRGGPDVIFDGLMPKPGRYRAWTQFRRNDKIHTFVTTFEVRERSAVGLGPALLGWSAARLWALSLRLGSGLLALGMALLRGSPRTVQTHGSLTTTVLFDREIVRILNERCVMCHVDDGLVVSARHLRADLAAGPLDASVSVAPTHAALVGGGRLRRVHQRQPPDVARVTVPRLVGRRARTAKRRQGLPQRGRSRGSGATRDSRHDALRPLAAG